MTIRLLVWFRKIQLKCTVFFRRKVNRHNEKIAAHGIALIQKAIPLYAREDIDEAAVYSAEIADIIGQFNRRMFTSPSVSAFMELIHSYLRMIIYVNVANRDNCVVDSSLKHFNELFLSKSFQKGIVSNNLYAKILTELIRANISAMNVTTVKKLTNLYYSQLNTNGKAYMMSSLLTETFAFFAKEKHLDPLIRDVKSQIRKNRIKPVLLRIFYGSKHSQMANWQRVLFVKNVYDIANWLDLDILEIEGEISRVLISSLPPQFVLSLVDSLSMDKKYAKQLEPVIQRYAEIKHFKNIYNIITARLKEHMSGDRQELIEREYSPSTPNYIYANYLKSRQSPQVSRSLLNKISKNTVSAYRKRIANSTTIDKQLTFLLFQYIAKYQNNKQKIWAQFNEALLCVPNVNNSDTMVLLVNYDLPPGAVVSLPLMIEAKKRGCILLPTAHRMFDTYGLINEEAQSYAGSFAEDDARYEHTNTFFRQVAIDITNKSILLDGVNVYEPIYECISRWQFGYFYHYDANLWAKAKTKQLLHKIDRIFAYLDELKAYSIKSHKRIRIFSPSPHAMPYAAYFIYCEHLAGDADMKAVCVTRGYDNYFSPFDSVAIETFTALNLTNHIYNRTSFLGTEEGFEIYYKDHIGHIDEIRKQAVVWFSTQRSVHYTDNEEEERERVLAKLKDAKRLGKKIYLMNGKVVFDLGSKTTEGVVHDDMSHWATHNVEVLKNNPNVLLLIKPHPYEDDIHTTMTREEIERFHSIIKTDLTENCIYLGNSLFRNHDLYPYIDVGLTWSGTSSLELASLGIKTIMGDLWGHYDYPIGFLKVNTIKEYEDLLRHPDNYADPDGLSDRALLFLSYYSSDYVRYENKMAKSEGVNYFTDNAIVNMDAVKEYIKNGDPKIEKLFDGVM